MDCLFNTALRTTCMKNIYIYYINIRSGDSSTKGQRHYWELAMLLKMRIN